MSPHVFEAFAAISRRYWRKPPTSVLELGTGNRTLLDNPQYMAARCIALNLNLRRPKGFLAQCSCVMANENHLPFKTSSLDCILSSSVLEHDKFFWRTLSEIRRVLRPGGLFIVGVPIYMTLPTDIKNTTLTFRRHGLAYDADFYRFSQQAVREVLLEGLQTIDETVVRRYPNPYVVAAGSKAIG